MYIKKGIPGVANTKERKNIYPKKSRWKSRKKLNAKFTCHGRQRKHCRQSCWYCDCHSKRCPLWEWGHCFRRGSLGGALEGVDIPSRGPKFPLQKLNVSKRWILDYWCNRQRKMGWYKVTCGPMWVGDIHFGKRLVIICCQNFDPPQTSSEMMTRK